MWYSSICYSLANVQMDSISGLQKDEANQHEQAVSLIFHHNHLEESHFFYSTHISCQKTCGFIFNHKICLWIFEQEQCRWSVFPRLFFSFFYGVEKVYFENIYSLSKFLHSVSWGTIYALVYYGILKHLPYYYYLKSTWHSGAKKWLELEGHTDENKTYKNKFRLENFSLCTYKTYVISCSHRLKLYDCFYMSDAKKKDLPIEF
jgi:hypothetical protein